MKTSNLRPTLIVIVGATGSGKTDLSIGVAQHFNVPIISTDSRQLYQNMAIGTAQPSAEQLAAVEHHLIACYPITEHYTCGRYETEALALLDELFHKHNVVVAVGGSGLYIDALCEGMDNLPESDMALREQLRLRAENEGLEPLLAQLKELDHVYFDEVDRANPQRVLRALEVCLQTGKPYSSFRTGAEQQRTFDIIKIGTLMDRAQLYDRINRRVDMMLAEGLEAEARALYPHKALNALQTVGYREFFSYFDGEISRDEATELIKRNSRRYAKRQMTWFNRDSRIAWFAPSAVDVVIDYLENKLKR